MKLRTKEQIEMLRQGLLTSAWCGFSKMSIVHELCDLALKGLESTPPEAPCNDWVKDAARSTNARVWGCTNDAIPDETVLDSPISLHHVTEMLGKIERGEITGAKAHRWLGWAQAVICVGGGATLDELKAINKAASDALSARSPLAFNQQGEKK